MKIVIGAAQFGMNYGIANKQGHIDTEDMSTMLNVGYNNRIKYIDTAEGYGNSEQRIGRYLNQNKSQSWSIITKCKANGTSPYEKCKNSIIALGQKPHAMLAHNAADFLDETFYRDLMKIKNDDLVNSIGVSVYTAQEIKEILKKNKPDIIQCPLSIMDSSLFTSGVLDLIKEHNIELHVRSVFLQGLIYIEEKEGRKMFGDAFQIISDLKQIAENYRLTLGELSLKWVNSLSQVDRIVIGMESVDQLQKNIECLHNPIDAKAFEEALSIKCENETILNPVLWPRQ